MVGRLSEAAMRKGTILITGASTGIGHACAVRFAELGFHVFAGVRKPADAEVLRAHSAGNVEPVSLDVTSTDSIAAAMKTVGAEPLAGLVNNAGIATTGPLELVPIDAWRRQFEVNVIGLVAVTQACLPALRLGRGRVVNVGSIADRCALPGSGPYDSSKFAVGAITDVLRMELRPWGISVSLIEAGSIATPIWDKSRREADELSRQVGPERYALYRNLMETVRREVVESAKTASPVAAVVNAVEHALTSRRPRTRYLVGRDTWFWRFLSWLPDRWRDRVILSKVHEG
jgi:NAD(P)-dependent dehydrogenase (short-subunit alcohol dehydrogenase family)